MITVHITSTGKGYSPKDQFRIFNESTERFADMREAKQWLKEHYGKCKRVPMYCDKKDGRTVKTGWVFGFRNADLSHAPVDKWIQQDWVSFSECKPIENDEVPS